MTKVILFTGLLAGGLFLTSTAQAALLAYEGFNYTPGSDLSGATGGGSFGFGANTWTAGTTGDSNLLAGLTYTDSLGNSLSNSGVHALFTGSGGSATPVRNFDFTRGTDGTTTWISFIGFRRGADTIRVANLQFRNGTTERIAFGKATTNVATATWSVYHSGAAANSVFSTNALDVSSFVLVRIDHVAGTNDNAYMWINPLLNSEPSLASASVTYTNYAEYVFNGIRGFAGNAQTGIAYAEFEVDEIRVGETYADVTPYTSGTPPAIRPGFTAQQFSGNDFMLTLTGAVNTVYTIFGATNVTQNPWNNLGTTTTSGAGLGTFTDTNALINQPQRIYRAQ